MGCMDSDAYNFNDFDNNETNYFTGINGVDVNTNIVPSF